MKKYYIESRSRGVSCMELVNGRLTGLVTLKKKNEFYNGL
jgi:hypothetical protein